MAGGFIVGLLTLSTKFLLGHNLLSSTYTALIVTMASSLIFLLSLRFVGKVLADFLLEKKLEADRQNELEHIAKAKEKVGELKQKRIQAEEENKKLYQETLDLAQAQNDSDEQLDNEEVA